MAWLDGYMRVGRPLDPNNINQLNAEVRDAQQARAAADRGIDGQRGNEVPYRVRPGDTLTSIARRYGQDPDELIGNNRQVVDPDRIYPDRIIFLPSPDSKTVRVHQAVTTELYLDSPLAHRVESMSDLSGARTQNDQLWDSIEQDIVAELRAAGANQVNPVAATRSLLSDIRARALNFAEYQQVVTRAYSTVAAEWSGSGPQLSSLAAPQGFAAPLFGYDPDYDPKLQPDLALRAELTARLLGGPANGKPHLQPEQIERVRTDELAAALADGNPIEQSLYANLYGGHDLLTNQDLRPLWERMGISRDELRRTLVEQPWKVASYHLGREFAAEDYAKLQAIDGPLGHLLNMGVDPRTALTLQATWSANFYGGHDPVTQAQLKPVWQQWGMESPQQLQQLFENDPAAAITLAELLGGLNPATGQAAPQPWLASPEQHGAQNLQVAQDLLDLQLLSLPPKLVPAGMWQPYVLGLTAPSVNDQIRYQNPLGLAQSPHIRNGKEIRTLGQMGLLTTTMDALGGMGLFGLVAGGNPLAVAPNAASGPVDPAAPQSNTPFTQKYQIHGFFQVFPGGEQESVWLLKVQRLPRFSEQQLQALRTHYEQVARNYHETRTYPPGQKPTAAQINERIAQAVQNEMSRYTQSRFVKPMGSWTDAGGNVMLFLGTADETGGNRARRPMIVGADWALATDGSLDRFGGIVGGPMLGKLAPGAQPYWHGAGLQFQMGRDSNGNWVPTSIPTPTIEWGTRRYQVYPMLYLDPDTHAPNGFNIWGGTGYHLAQVGIQNDTANPDMDLNLSADPATNNGMGPNVAYSDPSAHSFTLGYMGGSGGRALGFAVDLTTQSTTKVFVPIDARGFDAAKQGAVDLHAQLMGGNAPQWTDIPVGSAVSSTDVNSDAVRVMAFIKLFTLGAGNGSTLMSNTQVHRTGGQSWTIGRYEENQHEHSVTAGILGVGIGGRWWDGRLRGESFELTASGGQIDSASKEAVSRYLAEGLFPNALGLDGRFQGPQAEQYRQLRDDFIAAKTDLETKTQAALAETDDTVPPLRPGDSKKDQAESAAEAAAGSYWTAFERLNDFCRTSLKPGDTIMPGLKLVQTAVRGTDGVSGSLLFGEFYRREAVNGEIRSENNVVSTYELSRDWWFAPEVRQGYAGKTGQGPDGFTLSTRSEVKAHPPAVTNKPIGLPYDIVKDIPTNAYPVMLTAAGKDKDVALTGKLSVNLSAEQIAAIGNDLNNGPGSAQLWESFATRASAVFAQPNDTRNNLYARAPEYIDNAPLGLNREGAVLSFLKDEAVLRAGRHGVQVTPDLIEKFSQTRSPEAFRQLSEGERRLFADLVLQTASGDHSPYETLAVLAVTQTTATSSPPLLGEDARSAMFEDIVRHFEGLRFYPGNIDLTQTWIDPARVQSHQDPNARIYMEPTAELLRFVRDEPVSDETRGIVLGQSSFEASLPERVTQLEGKTLEGLKQRFAELAGPTGYYGEPAEINEPYARAPDIAATLIAIALKDGSDAAWQAMRDHGFTAQQAFEYLRGDDQYQILRQGLIDVLAPNAPPQEQALLTAQQHRVDAWLG